MEDFAHYVATHKARDERVLLIVDEFPAIAFGGANAASLFEMVRFHGAGIVVTAQSLAFQRQISFTERGMGTAVKEYAIGEGMLAEAEALAAVRRLTMLFAELTLHNLDQILDDPMLALANSQLLNLEP